MLTQPDEGTFIYVEGTVVDLMAIPDADYRFVEWTGDVDTIVDVRAATTTITMNGDYSEESCCKFLVGGLDVG